MKSLKKNEVHLLNNSNNAPKNKYNNFTQPAICDLAGTYLESPCFMLIDLISADHQHHQQDN